MRRFTAGGAITLAILALDASSAVAGETSAKVKGGSPAAPTLPAPGIELSNQVKEQRFRGVLKARPIFDAPACVVPAFEEDRIAAVMATVPDLGPGDPVLAAVHDALEDVVAVGDAGGFRCSGILVAPRHVLTARHCLPATRVATGPDLDHAQREERVTEAHAPDDERLDIALLRLAAPVAVPSRARRTGKDGAAPAGWLRVAGYGASDAMGLHGFGVLRRADLPVFGWGCDRSRGGALGCEPDVELLIPRNGGRDTCAGDSGGPVLELVGGAWRLLGITSRPVPGGPVCGNGGIYVRADRFAAWLDGQIEADRTSGEEP